VLATIFILAQGRGTQEPPDEGVGIGLILLGVLIVILVAAAVLFAFRTYSKKTRETGPDDTPHRPGHVGRVE
jgi:flagellar basal body-associated protein FliL